MNRASRGPAAAGDSRLAIVARVVSIVGHPLVVMSAASLAAWPGPVAGRSELAMGLAVIALAAMGYSAWRVRGGAWAHVDASHRGERRELHGALIVIFSIALAAGAWRGMHAPALWVLGLCLALVLLAGAASRWCKPSLHVAFACLASGVLGLAWPWALMPMAALAVAVAWSRLHLRRHTRMDVVVGAVFGVGAVVALWAAPGATGL